jgi:ATPase subunit of ABC transporter with duplicated ATPase domains
VHRAHGGTVAATDITIALGASTILEGVSFAVTPGARTGVVGANGAGKSTLLRALAGLEQPEHGRVTRQPVSLRVGYLPQERDPRAGETLLQYLARRTGVGEAEAAMLAATDPYDEAAYGDALERFLGLGGGDLEARAAQVTAEVGLPGRLDQELTTLSGGELGRAALASILLARFDVYLLDEPTNDLDFDGLDRLERFVRTVDGGVALVSHDREFLDRTVTRIVELEEGTGRVHEYAGGWSEYEEGRERARAAHQKAFAEWEGERDRFRDLASRRRTEARAGGAQADQRGTHALMSKTRAAARRLDRLETDEKVDKPWQPWELQIDLAPRTRGGDVVVQADSIVVRRGSFTLGPVSVDVGWGERIAVVGPNGSGKSTLLAALVGRLPVAAGTVAAGPGVVFGEIGQQRTALVGELLRAFVDASGMQVEEARTLLAKFDLYAEHVTRDVATLSPGERTRAELALQMALGANCLILDEPTNHLDLPAIEELERALADYTGTLLLVTHDRRFLDRVGVTRTVGLVL